MEKESSRTGWKSMEVVIALDGALSTHENVHTIIDLIRRCLSTKGIPHHKLGSTTLLVPVDGEWQLEEMRGEVSNALQKLVDSSEFEEITKVYKPSPGPQPLLVGTRKVRFAPGKISENGDTSRRFLPYVYGLLNKFFVRIFSQSSKETFPQ